MQRTILLLTITLFCTPLLAEEVYRWVDEKGTVNYTDRKPRSFSKKIKTPKVPANEPQQTATDNKAAPSSRCEEFRQRLTTYEAAPTLSQEEPNGELRELTAAERDQVLDDTRRQVEAFCKE